MSERVKDVYYAGDAIRNSALTHREIKFVAGMSIESCVEELIKYKEKDELVYGTFNNINLYSDSVSVDSAYMLIQNRTKKESGRSLSLNRVGFFIFYLFVI